MTTKKQRSRLREIIDQFPKKKILVIGDIILDRYIIGDTTRISPEAPVPILNVKSEKYSLGGAANVANNLAEMGAMVYIIGVRGNDPPGLVLSELLQRNGIISKYVLIDPNFRTIEKVRIVGKKQQMLRVDFENQWKNPMQTIPQIKCDAIIISDYAKGFITQQLIDQVKSDYSHIPICIDPKPEHKSWYTGATMIKPNLKEFEDMCGYTLTNEKELKKAGKALRKSLDTTLFLTRGEKGITIFSDRIVDIPTQQIEVYDPTGAGDTVMSVLTLAKISGATDEECAILANRAAGSVVEKLGTATIGLRELSDLVEESTKIKTKDEIEVIANQLREEGKRIVFTNGCYDILHFGHTHHLRTSKAYGDILILGLNTDRSITKLKGPGRPFMNEKERADVLSELSPVDYIVFFDSSTPIDLIKTIKPDTITKGGDYKKRGVVGYKEVRSRGGDVIIIPYVNGYSTSMMADRISKQHVQHGSKVYPQQIK